MIDVTKLFCGRDTTGDPIRYGHRRGPAHGNPHPTEGPAHAAPPSASDRRPVVAWNICRRCNLACVHCYTDSANRHYPGELTTEEGMALIDDLADFRIPALLFSGGEPLIRPDLFTLAAHARARNLRITLSTNGTLIDEAMAARIREAGFNYVGISLDGIGETNDRFRGMPGAFERAVRGIRNCMAVGQKVGLRLTLTRRNYQDLHAIFRFIEEEGIQRACFYHLVYAGRGNDMTRDDLSHAETRRAMDIILEHTLDFHRRGLGIDILTVDNHVDGPYLYLRLCQTDPKRAEEARRLLEWNGGGANSSGVGFGNIDPQGNVHPDQFWQQHTFGNVRERPFSEIWMDTTDPLMAGLKNRLPLLKGKCSRCRFLKMCGGSFRVRALAVTGDPWAPDPACYLTEEEISGE
ncbi:MAG TPA: radical SAM protein [Armatimonadota bacterium]|nr:radical SAM protein [Armatimonadota bacterium]HPT98099.1 radical SAM protein [Armatimonadota bacterium]